MHKSVGAIIKDNGKILMIDRKKVPLGWACPAGHIEEGETPEYALKREIMEETGLEIIDCHLVGHEYAEWNECSKGVKGHDWFVYEIDDWTGDLKIDKTEAKAYQWVEEKDIKKLKLEKVWKYWFEKLKVI